jgi:hypothetical protein
MTLEMWDSVLRSVILRSSAAPQPVQALAQSSVLPQLLYRRVAFGDAWLFHVSITARKPYRVLHGPSYVGGAGRARDTAPENCQPADRFDSIVPARTISRLKTVPARTVSSNSSAC